MYPAPTDLDPLAVALAASSGRTQSPVEPESQAPKATEQAAEATEPQGQAEKREGVGEAKPQGAERTQSTEATDDDLTKDPRFRRWQSQYDKRIAELEATIRRLQDVSPHHDRDEMATAYAELEQRYNEAVSSNRAGDASRLAVQLNRLAERIFEYDLRQLAQSYGLDLDSIRKEAIAARDRGEIVDPSSLEAFVLKHAYQRSRSDFDQRMAALQAKEQELQEREQKLEQTVREAVQAELAKQLQAMGLTDMTSLNVGRLGARQMDLSKARSLFEALTILSEPNNA